MENVQNSEVLYTLIDNLSDEEFKELLNLLKLNTSMENEDEDEDMNPAVEEKANCSLSDDEKKMIQEKIKLARKKQLIQEKINKAKQEMNKQTTEEKIKKEKEAIRKAIQEKLEVAKKKKAIQERIKELKK